MKWPRHRTNINRTLHIAKTDPAIQMIITSGLKNNTSTVDILQSIISLKCAENVLLTNKLEELTAAVERHIQK